MTCQTHFITVWPWLTTLTCSPSLAKIKANPYAKNWVTVQTGQEVRYKHRNSATKCIISVLHCQWKKKHFPFYKCYNSLPCTFFCRFCSLGIMRTRIPSSAWPALEWVSGFLVKAAPRLIYFMLRHTSISWKWTLLQLSHRNYKVSLMLSFVNMEWHFFSKCHSPEGQGLRLSVLPLTTFGCGTYHTFEP